MKYQIKGLNEYVKRIERVSNPLLAQAYLEKAISEGSLIVRNETLQELKNLPVDDRRKIEEGETRRSIRSVQKSDLINSFGVSPFQNRNDFLNVKTGVAKGLNRLKQPNVRVARMLENGTSYMPKNKVFSRASRKARKQCIEEMQRVLSQGYRDLMK